jgi:hypothetical protein
MPDESDLPDPPLSFTIAGTIVTWDAFGRWLRIGARTLWVAPSVSVAGLTPGARVTASGYQEDQTSRWIVTEFTLDAPRPRSAGDIPSW